MANRSNRAKPTAVKRKNRRRQPVWPVPFRPPHVFNRDYAIWETRLAPGIEAMAKRAMAGIWSHLRNNTLKLGGSDRGQHGR